MFDIFDAEQMLGIRHPQVTLTLHPRLSMVCHRDGMSSAM